MKYLIEVSEVLSRKILAEAETEDEAIKMVEMMYQNEDIVLDSSDFHGNLNITCLDKMND